MRTFRLNMRTVLRGALLSVATLATATLATATLALGGAAGPAGAVGTTCTFAADITITPGVSAAPGAGMFTTGGPVGTVDCGGSPGTLGFEGRYGTKDPDSCGGAFTNGNEGDGAFSLSTPGTGEVKSAFTFVYGTFSTSGGVVAGTFTGERMSGTFQLSPTAGDCFSAPITKARITGKGTLS